jgi:predicted esterase
MLLFLLFLSRLGSAQSLEQALATLRRAPVDQSKGAIDAVLARRPSLGQIELILQNGVSVPPAKRGWLLLQATDEAGESRPYQLYIPKSLKADGGPVPLLVSMHGGVARDRFVTATGQVGFGAQWTADADEAGFVVAYPLGRRDCVWWTKAGLRHIRATIRDVKRRAPIDDDRIVATGFSDGGSGAYFLALAAPDLFSGFLPMNGHPAVAASASRLPLYLRNLKERPLLAAMTQDDQLYPAKTVLPHLQAAIESGAAVQIVSYPSGGHRPVYWREQRAAFKRFVMETEREALPDEIDWWCADTDLGRIGWIGVDKIGPGAGDAEALPDLNIESRPGRVLLGVTVDRAFAGPGVRVTAVSAGSFAESSEMKPGDVIEIVDGRRIGNLDDLREALQAKKYGDKITLTWRRDREPWTIFGKLPKFTPRPIYRRSGPTARLSAKVDNNVVEVVSRNVRAFTIRLARRQFDFDEEVVVRVNGKERWKGKPVADPKFLLRTYAAEADAGRLFAAEVKIEVPAE